MPLDAQQQQALAQQQPAQGGGLMGVMAEGMAFGAGSSMARMAVGSMFGGGSSGQSEEPAAQPPAEAPPAEEDQFEWGGSEFTEDSGDDDWF